MSSRSIHSCPHFSEQELVSERIAVLNLNQPIPHSVPAKGEVPTEHAGTDVYPRGTARGERHPFLLRFIADQGALLFLVDQTDSGKLCIVRAPIDSAASESEEQYCPTAAELGANPGTVDMSGFTERPGGDLVLSFDVPASEQPWLGRSLKIDRHSLAVALLPNPDERSDRRLRVPWTAQKSAGLCLTVPDFGTAEETAQLLESWKAEVIVEVDGNVRDVALSGASPEGLDGLRKAILGWRFKPTTLDGRPVEVVTEISGPRIP